MKESSFNKQLGAYSKQLENYKMMQKSKKEKQERQLRLNLKTVLSLTPTLTDQNSTSLLSKLYPQIAELNSLRIFSLIQIIYLLETYLELLDKYNPLLITDFKIGIIGGGVTARLLLNSILPLTKDGLLVSNIILSTRQTDNFKSFAENFKVKVHFDNQKTAEEADFLVIATPATLDNYIITDLKSILEAKAQTSENESMKLAQIAKSKIISEKLQRSNSKMEDKKKETQEASSQRKKSFPFKPLVYVLTSDFHQLKSRKIFNFPVLIPSIRAKDIQTIKEALKMFHTEQINSFQVHKKIVAWWLFKDRDIAKGDQSANNQSQRGLLQSNTQQIRLSYSATPFQQILKVFSFVFQSSISSQSSNSSLINTINVSENIKDKKKQSQNRVFQILLSQGEISQVFLKNLRKWQMAYNNYIA